MKQFKMTCDEVWRKVMLNSKQEQMNFDVRKSLKLVLCQFLLAERMTSSKGS